MAEKHLQPDIGKARLPIIALLLFGSGFGALMLQMSWIRQFRLIFGVSTASTAAVLAIFMGGLGLGSLLLGPKVDRSSSPLRFYAWLEVGVAFFAACTPFFLWLVFEFYVGLGGEYSLGEMGSTLLRLFLSVCVLGIPTVLMGGTLPAAIRAATPGRDLQRKGVALIYGANTFGAVTGVYVSTFLLFELFGLRKTIWLASVLILAVAGMALWLSCRFSTFSANKTAEPLANHTTSREDKKTWTRNFVLFSCAVVGFSFFLMELVWYRLLGPLLGGSVYTFGIILAVALLGIALGSLLYGGANRERKPTLYFFSLTCLLETLCLAFPYYLGDSVAKFALVIRPEVGEGLFRFVTSWTLIAGVVVFPAAVVAGLQFPLLIGILGQGKDKIGRDVGVAYAWNTGGAIVGSIAGGFGLLPLLMAPGTWMAVIFLLLALSLVSRFWSFFIREQTQKWMVTAAAFALVVMLSMGAGPTAAWRHSGIGAGRFELKEMTPNSLTGRARALRRATLWEADGIESSIGLLISRESGITLVTNGKSDGSARGGISRTISETIIGKLSHSQAENVFVLGVGTGATAGWLASYPNIKEVDVVELEPKVLFIVEASGPINQHVLKSPKVNLIIGDGREYLLTTPKKYDIILSEPSNPFRAGMASLFTREFYESSKMRLKEKGILLQWLQAYEVDHASVESVVATLHSVFPFIEIWRTQSSDLMFVASNFQITYDLSSIQKEIVQEPLRSALAYAWQVEDVEGIFAHYVGNEGLASEIARKAQLGVNTDDLMLLDFSFARNILQPSRFELRSWTRRSPKKSAYRPHIQRGELNWERVEAERANIFLVDGIVPPLTKAEKEPSAPNSQIYRSYLKGDYQRALPTLSATLPQEANPWKWLMLGEIFAENGDVRALTCVEKLRQFYPVEANSLQARYLARVGKVSEASVMFLAALKAYRANPWPPYRFMRRTLGRALELAEQDTEFSQELFSLLAEPFPLHLLNHDRLHARVRLADRIDFEKLCMEVLQPFEPNTPWVIRFLDWRSRCYEVAGSPLLALAQDDVREYLVQAISPTAP